eukprot:TRINITY_DN1660_c0_g3_i1.p1 TRINITY_DN1660_c0_g3~~TRINITY_DN1660_c0_g3_i1.p1  ORF type:complete len:599 (+),score=80.60 TRINITY_DN1660_c0_g3_i1:185-1981(+)
MRNVASLAMLLLSSFHCASGRRFSVGTDMRLSDVLRSVEDGDVIELESGVHHIAEELVIEKDNIRIEGKGNGATINAGVTIPKSAFVNAGEGLLRADLSKLNINLGSITSGGLGDCANTKAEAFDSSSGKRLRLARYPNPQAETIQPLWNWMNIKSVVNSSTFVFGDEDKLMIQKAFEFNQTDPLWLHGFWKFDWADNYCRVMNVDLDKNMIITDPKTPAQYNLTQNARYMIVNSLAHLDEAEEYFVDYSSKQLYISSSFAGEGITMSNLTNGMSVINRYNFTLINTSIKYSQGTNLLLRVSDSLVSGGDFGSCGGEGLDHLGWNTTIENTVVSESGCKGIAVMGGDSATLTPSGNIVRNNTISRFSDWKRTYTPGVFFSGVGNQIIGNRIHTGPHQGIFGGGNDNYFAHNNVSHLVYETLDTGAWYAGRSWANRNNTLEYNTFSDIRVLEKTALGVQSVQAIYNDDQLAATNVAHNTFINCTCGAYIGGGRHHWVYNNTFINVTVPVHLDDRGLNWESDICTPPNGGLWVDLRSRNYTQPPYSTHYPDLLNIDQPCHPVHNNITGNRWCGDMNFTDFTQQQAVSWNSTVYNNTRFSC